MLSQTENNIILLTSLADYLLVSSKNVLNFDFFFFFKQDIISTSFLIVECIDISNHFYCHITQHKCLGEWNSYERAPDSAEKTTDNLHMDRQCKKQQQLHMDRQCKKTTTTVYIWTDSAKKQQQFTYGQTCKKQQTIYIWTVHIYRLHRRQCANTHIYSVHIVYYKDTLNYQRHIIHRMGTSTLCTVSIHNVVYT